MSSGEKQKVELALKELGEVMADTARTLAVLDFQLVPIGLRREILRVIYGELITAVVAVKWCLTLPGRLTGFHCLPNWTNWPRNGGRSRPTAISSRLVLLGMSGITGGWLTN